MLALFTIFTGFTGHKYCNRVPSNIDVTTSKININGFHSNNNVLKTAEKKEVVT